MSAVEKQPSLPPGPQRAALILLSLDEDVASSVLRHLDDAIVQRLSEYADELDPEIIKAIEPTFEEFERRMGVTAAIPHSDEAGIYLRDLATRALGQDRARKLIAPPPAHNDHIEVIRSARTATLAELLSEEHPQVAAVIISQLPRNQASSVLMAMPEDIRLELLARIASLSEIPRDIVQIASEALAKALAASGGIGDERATKEFDGVIFAAGLLNDLPAAESTQLLGQMDEHYAQVAPKLREAMFTFEDLARLNTRGLQVLMKEIQGEQILFALKTASEDLREHFFSAVSSRAAQSMRDDLSVLPPMRITEVESAQKEIVLAAQRLATEGRLVLPTNSAEGLV